MANCEKILEFGIRDTYSFKKQTKIESEIRNFKNTFVKESSNTAISIAANYAYGYAKGHGDYSSSDEKFFSQLEKSEEIFKFEENIEIISEIVNPDLLKSFNKCIEQGTLDWNLDFDEDKIFYTLTIRPPKIVAMPNPVVIESIFSIEGGMIEQQGSNILINTPLVGFDEFQMVFKRTTYEPTSLTIKFAHTYSTIKIPISRKRDKSIFEKEFTRAIYKHEVANFSEGFEFSLTVKTPENSQNIDHWMLFIVLAETVKRPFVRWWPAPGQSQEQHYHRHPQASKVVDKWEDLPRLSCDAGYTIDFVNGVLQIKVPTSDAGKLVTFRCNQSTSQDAKYTDAGPSLPIGFEMTSSQLLVAWHPISKI